MATLDRVATDPLTEKVAAWWVDVLGGGTGRDHPIFGNNIRARLKEDTLEVSGVVESRRACVALRKEIRALQGTGITSVDFDVRIDGPPGERLLLTQQILAFFVNDEQAEMAERYLDGHPDVRPLHTRIVHRSSLPGDLPGLPNDWIPEVERGFKSADSLLVLEVDEVEAFRANELLAETQAHTTLVLPPRAY